MGIRFFIPLPGPFYYAPGRKHPKQQYGENQFIAAVTEAGRERLRATAHNFANAEGYAHPELFADTAVSRHKTEKLLWTTVGVIAALVAGMLLIGPGIVLVALIPGVGLLVLVPAALVGVLAALIACRTRRIFRLTIAQLGNFP